MIEEVTKGIKVMVDVEYQPHYSSPSKHYYAFTYKIIIHNNSKKTVQLKNRRWIISDAGFSTIMVEGKGVVGKQPTLNPGQKYQYISGCNIKSGMGKMQGSYEMERLMDGQSIIVQIPKFQLIAPFKLN